MDARAHRPIVLIHGWTASIHWWDRITPLLMRRYHVVRVDLLGHGGSAKPKQGYSMEEQADRVAAALERLGVRSALIAGHSTGGEVAIALAARHPKLTRALAVVDTEPDERFVDPDFLARLSLVPVVGQALKRLATDSAIRDGIGQAFEKGYDVPDVFVSDFKKLTYTAYKKTYDESGDYVDDGHLARDLRSVRVPRLIIFGRDDRLVTPAAEAAATTVSSSRCRYSSLRAPATRRWSSSRPRRRGCSRVSIGRAGASGPFRASPRSPRPPSPSSRRSTRRRCSRDACSGT